MVKLAILLRQRKAMSFDAFVVYPKTNPAALSGSLPRVPLYVRPGGQGPAVQVSLPGLPPPQYDGTTEVWFDEVKVIN